MDPNDSNAAILKALQDAVKPDPNVVTSVIREPGGKFRLEVNGARVPTLAVRFEQCPDGSHVLFASIHSSHIYLGNDNGATVH